MNNVVYTSIYYTVPTMSSECEKPASTNWFIIMMYYNYIFLTLASTTSFFHYTSAPPTVIQNATVNLVHNQKSCSSINNLLNRADFISGLSENYTLHFTFFQSLAKRTVHAVSCICSSGPQKNHGLPKHEKTKTFYMIQIFDLVCWLILAHYFFLEP